VADPPETPGAILAEDKLEGLVRNPVFCREPGSFDIEAFVNLAFNEVESHHHDVILDENAGQLIRLRLTELEGDSFVGNGNRARLLDVGAGGLRHEEHGAILDLETSGRLRQLEELKRALDLGREL